MAESRTALYDLTKKWQVFLCAREVKVEFRTTFLVKLQRAVLDSVNKRNGKNISNFHQINPSQYRYKIRDFTFSKYPSKISGNYSLLKDLIISVF